MEAAVFGAGLDYAVGDARHLGCQGHIGHALAVGAGGVFPEISLELVTKTVLGLADGDGGTIQKAQRNRALPCLDSLVVQRNWPDCCVERSSPRNLRNWR